MANDVRDGRGRFAKGGPGNPNSPGRPKGAARTEYNAWAQDRREEWLVKLEAAAKADPRIYMWLLDQHMGKALQATEVSGPDGGPVAWLAMQQQLKAAIEADE